MAQVSDKVLAWLYSVLHEYQDPQRTYSDTARALAVHPSLNPRTEVYTTENGNSALLLNLSGTLPVTFRGMTYRFPVKVWVPQSYPQESPIPFVVPGRDMVIRPGQHVAVEGRVYHPYLKDWPSMWDRASMTELLECLQQVFAREPPVISKAQQQQYQRPIGQQQQQQQQQPGTGAAPPQLPPKQREGSTFAPSIPTAGAPPPRPPKPGEAYADTAIPRTASRSLSRNGPPLPPLPHERPQSQVYPSSPPAPPQNSFSASSRPTSQAYPPSQGYENGQPQRLGSHAYPNQQYGGYAPSLASTISPINGYHRPQDARYSQPASLPPPEQPQPQPQPPYQQSQPPPGQPFIQNQAHAHSQPIYPQQYPQHPPQTPYYNPSQAPPAPKPPPPDLLSDPFDVNLTTPDPRIPSHAAPPIPPNPEKEHLLHALSTQLTTLAQQKTTQTLSALPALHAQSTALRAAHSRLEAELTHLSHLSHALASNERILHAAIRDCAATTASARSTPPPPVDDVLVAPNVVAQQLWRVCADEAACGAAMRALQKGVDRGRIGAPESVRVMRGLGRERFLRLLLARRCARGLGLEVGR